MYMALNAREERPDLILIAGDIFDSRDVRLDSQSAKLVFEVISRLADVAPVAVLIGTPSHDGMAAEVLSHIRATFDVIVSSRPEQIYLTTTNHWESAPAAGQGIKAVLSMVPTPTKQFFKTDAGIAESNEQIAQAMSGLFAGFGARAAAFPCPHIMVGHFSVGGAFVSETRQLVGVDIEMNRAQIELAQADVCCLGHIHLRQKIGYNIFYSGSIYRKDFGEIGEHGFFYHEISENRKELARSRPVNTPTRLLLKIEADYTKDGTDITDLDTVPSQYIPGELKGAVVRVELKVWQEEAEKIDRQNLLDLFGTTGAADVDIRIIRVPRETVRSERLLKLRTLREKILEMATIKGEPVSESILAKADQLESTPSEQIIKTIGLAN
jgi:DNA repair exonuclease SbcCD nuclease subunit